MHHRLQPRQNLQILLLVKILALFDLRRLRLSLLLRLTNLDPLLHGKMLTDLGKSVFRKTEFGEDGTFDWGQGDVVVRSVGDGVLVYGGKMGGGKEKEGARGRHTWRNTALPTYPHVLGPLGVRGHDAHYSSHTPPSMRSLHHRY